MPQTIVPPPSPNYTPGPLIALPGTSAGLTVTGTTTLLPQANPRSPTGFSNAAGWAVNADASMYFDVNGNRVAV